jgi:DNA-binding beta-propeller fold protein YncE
VVFTRRAAAPVSSLACLVLLLLPPAPPAEALQVTGLRNPQSFVTDPATGQYFISNTNDGAAGKAASGFITKLDRDGKTLDLHFIRGGAGSTVLHAPKGLAVVKDVLYVADLDVLRGFDTKTGRPVAEVRIGDGRTDLADVAYDEGRNLLYVSDPGSNTVFRVDPSRQHAVSVLARDPALAGPRGLAVNPKTGQIVVVSWEKGKILELSPEGAITELAANSFFSSRFQNLDGVDFDGWGTLYVSDYTAGKVWRMRSDRHFDVIAEFLPSPADIGVDRRNHLILVPYHDAHAAEMNGLESPTKSGKKPRNLADYGLPSLKGPADGKDDRR